MTEQHNDPTFQKMEKELGEIREKIAEMKRVPPHVIAQYAATPDGREKMAANRAYFLAYRQLLAAAVRDLADVDRILEKALRKSRWALRA